MDANAFHIERNCFLLYAVFNNNLYEIFKINRLFKHTGFLCASLLLEYTMISYGIHLITRDVTARSAPASLIFRATTSTTGYQNPIMTQKDPLIFS